MVYWSALTKNNTQKFLIDWHHNYLKNAIDLLLFYKEHFYMDFQKVIYETSKKKHSFHNKHIYIYMLQAFWSFILYIL